MSEFINTIDKLGDDVVLDSIVNKTITEFKDDIVLKVGDYSFDSCRLLESVDLPNATEIGSSQGRSFQSCRLLKTVKLPNVTNIKGEYNFSYCYSLESMDLSKLSNISDYNFYNCISLSSLNIPNINKLPSDSTIHCISLKSLDLHKATSIGSFKYCFSLVGVILRSNTVCILERSGAFNDTPIAKGLGYIYVPRKLIESYKTATNWSAYKDQFRAIEDYSVDGTVTGEINIVPYSKTRLLLDGIVNKFYNNTINTVKMGQFYNCDYLVDVNLPNVTSINHSTFRDCNKLITIYMPKLENIETCSFYCCTSLKNISLPNVTQVGGYSFYKCDSLQTVDLPNATTIGEYAFQYCPNLTSVNLPNVTKLNNYSFSDCTSLESIDLPKVTDMQGYYTFSNCTKLSKLILRSNQVCKVNSAVLSNTPISKQEGYICVPPSLVEKYKVANYWKNYATQIVGIGSLDALESIEINTNNTINTYKTNSKNINVTYNGGNSNLINYPEQEAYTISVDGNATLDGNVLTLTDNAQLGDIITVTVTSDYNNEIVAVKQMEVVYREPSITVNLNNGQWVDSGTTKNGNVVYKSDAGSYNINNGVSTAILTVDGYTNVKLYIRSYAESYSDYTEAFAADESAIRGQGLYTTAGKSSSSNYIECAYELDGDEHTIEIMYSKNNSGNTYDDRGYFYIGECKE
jgi:hypothetical protein